MANENIFAGMSNRDRGIAKMIIGDLRRAPDLIIMPDGEPYLYRWYLVKSKSACAYFHVQVASDPERPLHDHPWDNQSVILAGGYTEIMQKRPPAGALEFLERKTGDVIQRKATDAHRLLLPEGVPYTMSLFTTGPSRGFWGFWMGNAWISEKDCVITTPDGRSVFKLPEGK